MLNQTNVVPTTYASTPVTMPIQSAVQPNTQLLSLQPVSTPMIPAQPVVTKTTTTGTVNISDINIKNDSDVEIIAKVNGTEKKIFDGKGSTFKSTYMTGNTFNFKQLLIDKNVDPDSEITMTINTEI